MAKASINNLEQFGFQFLAQGHFGMWTGGAEDHTTLVPIAIAIPGISTLPVELQPLQKKQKGCCGFHVIF